MGRSQCRSWKPLNVQEKCFFSHMLKSSPCLHTNSETDIQCFPPRGTNLKRWQPCQMNQDWGEFNWNISETETSLVGMTYHQYCFFCRFQHFSSPKHEKHTHTHTHRMYSADWTECFLDVLKHEIQRTRLAGSLKFTIGSPAHKQVLKIYGDDS